MHPITAVPRTWHFLQILSVAQLSTPKKQGALINIGCDWSQDGWSGRHGRRGAARDGLGSQEPAHRDRGAPDHPHPAASVGAVALIPGASLRTLKSHISPSGLCPRFPGPHAPALLLLQPTRALLTPLTGCHSGPFLESRRLPFLPSRRWRTHLLQPPPPLLIVSLLF